MITAQAVTARYLGKPVVVPVASISHFVTADKYVEAHHAGGTLLLSESLNSIEATVPGFVRTHRKVLVARQLITRVAPRWLPCGQRWGGFVTLSSGDEFPVSRRNLRAITAMLHPQEVPA
jgi:DNA-binding LytR/AlgR family response regulator